MCRFVLWDSLSFFMLFLHISRFNTSLVSRKRSEPFDSIINKQTRALFRLGEQTEPENGKNVQHAITATNERILELAFLSFFPCTIADPTRAYTADIYDRCSLHIKWSWCADCSKVITIYDATRHYLAQVLRSQPICVISDDKNFPMTPLFHAMCTALVTHVDPHSNPFTQKSKFVLVVMRNFSFRRPFLHLPICADHGRTKGRMCDCLHLQMNYCPKVTLSLVSHICYYNSLCFCLRYLSNLFSSFLSERPSGFEFFSSRSLVL